VVPISVTTSVSSCSTNLRVEVATSNTVDATAHSPGHARRVVAKDAPIDPDDFGFTRGLERDRSDRREGVLGSEVDSGLFGVQAAHDPKGVVGSRTVRIQRHYVSPVTRWCRAHSQARSSLTATRHSFAALDDLAGR
jgi:hypothetical protein